MEDILEIQDGACRCTVIQKEIIPKGKGYILLREGPPDSLPDLLDTAATRLMESGAREIYCAGPGLTVGERIRTKKWTFRYHSDMDELEKGIPVPGFVAGYGDLTFRELSSPNRPAFLRIYNDCFFHVPNSATYTDADMDRIMGDPAHSEARVVFWGNEPVGIYELSFETDIPEIASLGVIAERRKTGIGKNTLRFIQESLGRAGYRRVSLKVSTANPDAYRLYRQIGFVRVSTLSHWYRAEMPDRQARISTVAAV